MLNKNDEVILTISGFTAEGNGVGKIDGLAVFVPFTAIGDTVLTKIVKLKKNYAFGIIIEILTPSSNRIPHDCAVFTKCGGCLFRHITYNAELAIKENLVSDAFQRIGGFDIKFQPILGSDSTEYYRNKAQYPVTMQDGKVVCGFYSRRSHRVIPYTACKLQPKIFENIVNFILEKLDEAGLPGYNEGTGEGLVRHIYLRKGAFSQEIMVCLVVKNDSKKEVLLKISNQLVENFQQIETVVMNINPKNTNVILGDKNIILIGKGVISDTICGNKVSLSPHSFYQINTKSAELLYGIVKEYASLSGNESVMDLYCGVGTIGMSLANVCSKILGVEIISQAVENAIKNAGDNNLANMEFICGDAGEVSSKLRKEQRLPQVIIVDPPRKGCDEKTLEAMLQMAPEKIIMVSCDPSTAARDCRILCDNGYYIQNARAVDMFPRTGHVECVCLLTRNR